MKNYVLFLISILFALSVCLSACGAPQPMQPTRQQQLADTGLFGRHQIDGVSIDKGFTGDIHGGFFLFAAGLDGNIASTTDYTVELEIAGDHIWVTLPRTMFRMKPIESGKPQVEFIFKQAWLDGRPQYFKDDEADFTEDANHNTLYTDGAKLNLNNFIKIDNLDIVYIYITADDLKQP